MTLIQLYMHSHNQHLIRAAQVNYTVIIHLRKLKVFFFLEIWNFVISNFITIAHNYVILSQRN